MKVLTPLSAAMDFLTRLAPARIHDDATIEASVKYFPVAGMVVGTLCTAPFALGVLRGHPWLQAWLLLCLSLWITRGLHWDGVADIVDAWGASVDKERFWTVIKDSRIGAFGGMALVLGLVGQLLLLHEAAQAGAWNAIAFSFIFGRGLCVGLAYSARHLARSSGLGLLTLRGATPAALVMALILTLLPAFPLGLLPSLAPILALGLLGLVELHTLARRVSGLNGDFLGACIIWGELAALLGWAIAANTTMPPF